MEERKKTRTPGGKLGTGVLSVALNGLMLVFTASCIFPLIWMLYSSLKNKRDFNKDIIGLPKSIDISNYVRILSNSDYHLTASLINSFRTTILSVFFIVLFGFILGYFLSRVRFKGSRILWVMLLMGMLVPVHSLLVPIYVVFNGLGLSNQWFTLLFPYIAFGLPIAVFLIQSFIKGIPTALEEAAAIDGSSFSGTLFQIIMPICRPVMVTVAIIQTFTCWNEFSFALILIKDALLQTVPLAVNQFTGQFTSDYPKIMAAMLVTMSPIVLLYFGFSREVIKGMVAGAVKG